MDTTAFLKTILPGTGIKLLAEPVDYTDKITGETKTGWRYHKYDDLYVMAQAAGQMDAQGRTVYHACSSYNDWYTDEKTGKRRVRTQVNVVACRSLYDDFDVSEDLNKDVYRSREDALQGIKQFAVAIRIRPLVTSSGGGFHVYLPLDEDVSPDTWIRLARKKRAVTTHLGLKVDHAVDTDSARVLRPVGTHNRKLETPRSVTVVMEGKQHSVEQVESALNSYIEQHQLSISVPNTVLQNKDNLPLWAQDPVYPPSSAIQIVKHCAALKGVADAKGDCEEPLWRAMLGVVKFTVEGDALAHEWSAGYAKYDPAETQAKLDNWHAAPTTCEHFDALKGCMKDCSRSGKQKSPIHLGYTDEIVRVVETPPPKELPVAELPHIEVNKRKLYFFPNGYSWNGRYLCKRVVDSDGVVTNVPFAHSLFYPITRVRNEDGMWAFRCASLESNGKWKEFNIATQDISSGDTLAKSLAQYEVFLVNHKAAKGYAMDYKMEYILSLQYADKAVRTYRRFGWADDYTSFIMGNRRIHPGGEEEVLCSPDVPLELQSAFSVKGTVEEWVADIDFMFNRPGAELNQYALCHAFAAVLSELTRDVLWHGIPMALIGPGGKGKSTVAMIAAGAFGDANAMSIQGTNSGTTSLGALGTVEIMNGLPLLIDETSGRTPEELRDIAYAIANGKRRTGLTNAGKLRASAQPWFGSPFMTSNQSIYAQLGLLAEAPLAIATQLRIFEFPVDEDYLTRVFPDVENSDIKRHLREQYGTAGRVFIRFVMEHRVWVIEQLIKANTKLNPSNGDETAERYYRSDLACSWVAGKIAKRLGLINFDMKHLMDWTLEHILSLRSNRDGLLTSPSDFVAQMISELHGRMIITKELRDGRSEGLEEPIVPLKDAAVGRVLLNEKRVFVHSKFVADWAKKHKVSQTIIKAELDRLGLLIHNAGEGSSIRFRIGKGTPVMSAAAICYELSYNKIMGNGKLELVRPPMENDDEAAAH